MHLKNSDFYGDSDLISLVFQDPVEYSKAIGDCSYQMNKLLEVVE